MSESIVANPYI